MITFQENTHFSQALPCTKEEFWAQVRKPNTAWRIDARRAIIAAVEASKTQGVAAIQTWLNNADYQKFLLKKQNLKREAAKQAWESKSDAEKLLAFAQEIKDNSVAFIYSCYEFDETQTEKGKPFRHRRLADCHLNGLFMLDIDHVENPMQIWYKLREDEELMKKVRAREEAHFRKYGTREIVTEDDPEFLATCPMTRYQRPEWDERVLTDLGFKVEIQRDIGRFVYGDWEKELYAESPLFEICAKKVK